MTYDPPEPLAIVAYVCLAIAIILFIIAVILHERDNPQEHPMDRMTRLDKRIEALEKDLEDYDALNETDSEDQPYDRTRRYMQEELDLAREELAAIEDALEERAGNAGRW